MKENGFSAQELSAFIDGELDSKRARQIESTAARDSKMGRHLAELRQVRSLVRLAFEEAPPAHPQGRSRRPVRVAVAASALLAAGVAIGAAVTPSSAWNVASLLRDGVTMRQPVALADDLKTIFHISSANTRELDAAFAKLETLLHSYERENKRLTLEVIVNADGLHVLSADNARYADRVRNLQARYGNLTFLACRQTIERVRAERKIDVKLLPGVLLAKSALDQIIMRLREGWVYIRA